MIYDIANIQTAYTHSGNFHADDVFSAALLRILNPNIQFIRVNFVPDNIENAIVFDIGGGEFDHHQNGSPIRENGIPYASFGLLWKAFGNHLTDTESVQNIDKYFVSYIDSVDNGIGTDNLSLAISTMNPIWNERQDYHTAFENAVQFAKTILERIIKKENAKKQAYNEVKTALMKANNGIVILERFAPYEEILVPTNAVFVIYPSNRGGYNISAVPQEVNTKTKKIPFPESWCYSSDEDLPRISGIATLRFCHKNGFLAATETLQDAVTAAQYAKKEFEKRE